ncbi:histone protein [Streptomyces sp. RFCAC02]|uniref:histone protein n=1 Tax=Streptomyces sp. RFCAC02 TaxID=2499143 RepID=UPI00143CF132|nr:histone protein [Streptomyces sp. RFCAC02]
MDNSKAALAAGIASGYLLGRRRKARLAIAVATYAMGRRFGTSPKDMASAGLRKLAGNGQLAELGGQMRDQLLDAGRTLADERIGSLADALHKKTEALGDGRRPDRDEDTGDEDRAGRDDDRDTDDERDDEDEDRDEDERDDGDEEEDDHDDEDEDEGEDEEEGEDEDDEDEKPKPSKSRGRSPASKKAAHTKKAATQRRKAAPGSKKAARIVTRPDRKG